VAISFLAVVLGVLKGKRETSKLLSIVLFMISLRTLAIWRTKPWGFTIETDSSNGLLLSNLMNELGEWYFGMGLSHSERVYSYFPALHLWTVALAKIAGLNTVLIARSLFPVLAGSLTIVFYYLAMRSVLTKKVAMWASFVLCLNPAFIFFDAGYVHESFALIFYTMYLLVVSRVYFEGCKDPKYIVVGALAVFVLILSHHWTAYNVLMISILFLGFPAMYSYFISALRRTPLGRARTISTEFTGLTFAIVLLWLSFIAFSIFIMHIGMASDFFESVVNPFAEHPYPAMEPYTLQERVIISLGILVLVVLGFTELLVGLSKKEKSPRDFLFEYWFFFSSVYIFSATYLIPLEFKHIFRRAWPFAFFGLSPLIAKNVAKGRNPRRELTPRVGRKRSFSHLKPIVLIFPLISCVLLAPIYYRVPSFHLPGDSYYSAAQWITRYLPNETITVDPISSPVLVVYGRAQKSTEDFDKVISTLYQNEDIHSIPMDWQVLVFNKYISTRYPDVSANPSLLNRYCNRIYDSEPLTIFTR
jgi:hypothetical protein